MRYITVITVLLAIGGCSAISDFAGYTFEEKYAPDGGAAGAAGWFDPRGYAGAAGGFEPLAGAGGAAGALAGQGGMAGRPEPLAGAGGQAGEPWVEPEPEPDAGIEPEPDAGISPPVDAGQVEPDAGPAEPDTMICQPCEVDLDCETETEADVVCRQLYVDGGPWVCLVHNGAECSHDLVKRADTMCAGMMCFGLCVPPQDGSCEAWLDARGY